MRTGVTNPRQLFPNREAGFGFRWPIHSGGRCHEKIKKAFDLNALGNSGHRFSNLGFLRDNGEQKP